MLRRWLRWFVPNRRLMPYYFEVGAVENGRPVDGVYFFLPLQRGGMLAVRVHKTPFVLAPDESAPGGRRWIPATA